MLIKELLSLPSNIIGDELLLANKNKKGKQKMRVAKESHFQELIPVPTGFKRKKYYKNCQYCYSKNIKQRKQICLQCKSCVVPLCAGKCFEDYHKQGN